MGIEKHELASGNTDNAETRSLLANPACVVAIEMGWGLLLAAFILQTRTICIPEDQGNIGTNVKYLRAKANKLITKPL
jgi:hypothetical protein